MTHFRSCMALLLLLSLLVSLIPGVHAADSKAVAEERPETKAVSVSSISVPAYSGGTSSGWMTYDCGQYLGLANTGTESKMKIVTGTNATQFLAYGTSLKDQGYTVLYEKKIAAQTEYNRHYKFLAPDGSHVIYTYFVDAYKETRIIVDTNADSFRRFTYTPLNSQNNRTEIYMVPFSASEDGYYYGSDYGAQNRNNAGAMYVIRFADNSLFVVDGGSYIQMSDRDCERVYAFLRKLTGIPEGEKIVINTWFVTHYHDDHVSGFPRFLSKYYDQFDLLNVMYNFDVVGASGDNMEIVGKLYPNAKYYKQHTGEYFTICDVRFDVLYTVEDLYTPSGTTLTLSNTACMRKSGEENNCSSVLRVTMGGKEILLTGDIYDADRILLAMYPEADLKSDVLQLPHHAFDGHVTLVKAVSPTISFLNQVESATNNRKDLYTNNHNWMPYAGTIYYGNSNLVGYCAETGVFLQEPFTDDVDWLGWGNLTWDMEEANYTTSSTITDSDTYYRYDRVTTAPTKFSGTYMIVDDKLGYPLSYNSSNGTIANGSTAFYTNDTFYFGASQRRSVNWSITSGTAEDMSLILAEGGKGYYVSTAIKKGSSDYWGTNTKNSNMALGRSDTYTASGLFGAWASFTNQMESTTNSIRMDMLQDNTFLIYARYNGTNGSTYHPLYRDAYMATTDKGWGASNLTKAAANEKLDYLKLRLYTYTATTDTLLLSWTGHKDYYANPGISKSQALSLLTADLRVNYKFKKSGHSGEIYYDGWQKNAAGTYWLEFPSGFGTSSAAGNYTITIKFKNHAGTTLTLGSVTLHLRNRSSDPAPKQLFFDFTDSTTARKTYQYETQYKGINFDATSRWEFIEYNASTKTNDITNGFVDTANGTLTLYTKTADTARKNLSIRAYAGSYNPLNYSPKNAEVVQIRFKAENLKSASDGTANFRLCYYKDGGTDLVYETTYNIDAKYLTNGEYTVITIPLSSTFKSCTSITGIRPAFSYVIPADTSKPGIITIDYLYIGPEANAPKEKVTVTFANEDGTVLQQTPVDKGSSVTYAGATPTKSYDTKSHYTFAGWVDANGKTASLSNITANLTVYASFTAVAHSYTSETVTAAGCETAGQRRNTCSCGYSYTESVAATGHSYTYKATKNPTTSATGILTGTCSKCSGTTTVSLPKLNTTDYTKTVTKAPTCIATGVDTYKWNTTTYGTFSFTATSNALGHSYTAKVTAPTCTAQGYTIHTCSRCSDSYKDTYTNPTGHSYTSKVTTAATCTNAGVKTFTCSKCSHSYTEAIAATGHTEVVDKAVAATCTTAGKTEGSHCSVCNAVIKAQTTVPATGHSYTSKVTTAATCTKAGVKTFTCSKCNHSYTEAIAATGHTEVVDKAVAATCTTAGKTEGSHCSVCNAVIKAQTTIPATGHSYTSKVTTAATCTKAGVKTFTCSKCNHSYTEAIATTGHTEVVDKAVAATCTTAGKTEGSHCSVCNAVIKAQTTIPATGHSYSYKSNGNGTHTANCARCNDSYTENHNFGNGTCACGDAEITLDESIKILHTLDLASDISVTFAVQKTALANYDSYYLECVLPEYSGNAKIGTSTVQIQPVVSGNYYYFTLTGITAVRMGDMVDAVLHMTKGEQEYYSKTDSYSVATYAYGMLNSSKDAKMLTLCADLLRYGAEAQSFKGYRTDALVDADMTETHRSYLSSTESLTFTATDSYLGDLANPTVTWVGKTLDLGSKVGMKFVFNAKNYTGDLSKLSMKVSYVGSTGETKTVTVSGIETYNANNKQYSFTFYGLLASELRTIVDVAIYNGNTQLSETLRYSAESYAAKTGTTALAALTKALFAYSDSAKAYFTK